MGRNTAIITDAAKLGTVAVVIALSTTSHAQSSSGDKPSFGKPRWYTHDNNACAASAVSAVLAPDNSALSILRSGSFLEVGGPAPLREKARCAFKVPFTAPLKSAQTIRVDVRGGVSKSTASRASVSINLANCKRASFEYAMGSTIDGVEAYPTATYLLQLPAGTSQFTLVVEGSASAKDHANEVLISIDSFDIAFANLGETSVPTQPTTTSPAAAASSTPH